MKNLIITFGIAILFTGFVGFRTNSKPAPKVNMQEITEIIINDSVQLILEKSCLPCHGADGSSKAKMKWNFEKMPDMKTTKQVSKLAKIVSVLEKGKMPTTKFIKKYPDRNLTEDEKNMLIKWAEEQAEKLIQ
ncbi:MAG TPA: hypothetical protein ENJ14_02245 [Bacteroidetes bacterium]|nr:MAG: hypothetical protein DRI87_10510 [Bacteroidota bacterium]RLD84106.1 MAG: hypothetical protein DRJ02_12075 [Bacteroidota bacterium]HHL57743.1 hypothetical protein [Bacteroidota bacterium]